jgi:anhydro-N-acetylmuramic acid kinase
MVGEFKKLNILGIMSGTSLDGLDLALCSFGRKNSVWVYEILKARTIAYSSDIYERLKNAIYLNADELSVLDHDYGKWIGNAAIKFLGDDVSETQWISSHGHTVFHQPVKGYTLQIGNGNDIAATTGIPVVFDFRSLDVALGGQGAPLVPAGDEFLFSEYDFCLNLGGFSNISYKKGGRRIAFDICPVNMGLNYLAGKIGLEYDKNGTHGRQGKIIPEVLHQLDNLDFYFQSPPKSLGREWFIEFMEPLLNGNFETKDLLRSLYEHAAVQISNVLNVNEGKRVIITGGGAKNALLVELISQKTRCEIVIPEANLVDFKEALIFAFLGYLRINRIPNVFSSVTGAMRDSVSGVIVGETLRGLQF